MRVAAAVSIFCLLTSCLSVSSAPKRVADTQDSVFGSALFAKIEDQVVAQCSIRWEGDYFTEGKKLYLIANSKNVCYECGPCTGTGMHCEKMSRSCPTEDLTESSSSGSGENS